MNLPIPTTEPHPIAPDTWVITSQFPLEPGVHLPVNCMLIRGEQPIVVDTGAPVHRDNVLRQIFSLVDPEDVRWIFLSHDDGDHKGALFELLERCPNATLVTNYFTTDRQALEDPLPLTRMRWLEAGETLDAGDRRLRLILPPIFDGPTTRGLLDERTGAMWAVDSFGALTTGGYDVEDVPRDLFEETFPLINSLVSPWHQWLDPTRYGAHTASVAGLAPSVVASAHGPVLRGAAIDDAFERVLRMAGEPRIEPPGQDLLDQLIAEVLAADAAA